MNFFTELFVRLFGPTPKFFKTLRLVSLIIGILGTVGNSLLSDPATPESWTPIISTIMMYIGYITALISQLTLTSDSKKEEGIKD